ncbi:MAG: inorganic diphosphatase, partial [Clostridia bacterium]|nr:inorganic diphosphatase [Clostridia bacterium]
DLPDHLIEELMHFLSVYKELEGKHTEISKFHDSKYAHNAITKAMKLYNSANGIVLKKGKK